MLATVLPVAVFMLILYRLWSVYQVTKNTLESIPALGQDFFTVGNKEKSASFSRVLFPEVSVIKCSNYRLTGTSMSQVVDMFVFYKIQSILDSILLLSQS